MKTQHRARILYESPRRWTPGSPKMVGYYDCRLESGRVVIARYSPGMTSEIHPHGEILQEPVVEYQRIPGEKYRRP